jgi:MFS family permease
VYFLVVYTIGEFGCRGGWLRGTLLGLPAAAVVITTLTVAALAIGAWATVLSFRAWRAADGEQRDWVEEEDRSRFMFLAGLILGALFTYLILLTGLPAVVLPRCE